MTGDPSIQITQNNFQRTTSKMRERVPTNRKIDKSSRTFVFFLRKIFKIFIYRYFKSEKSVWINSSNSFFLTASTFYKPSIFVIFSIILVPSGVFVGIKIRIYMATWSTSNHALENKIQLS